MAVSIRLSLFGKKGQPVYRIVATEARSKRNGKFIDILGVYNPNTTPPTLKVDQTKIQEWVKKGALISDGIKKILDQNTQK